LDSYQAQRAVELLKDLATNGDCTVIASIHQPRASIFALFDDITLVADGRCLYTGAAKEMEHWFRSLGYPCPKHYNPAGRGNGGILSGRVVVVIG
jgi:ABC-type multidrug transport system ATPase subunit